MLPVRLGQVLQGERLVEAVVGLYVVPEVEVVCIEIFNLTKTIRDKRPHIRTFLLHDLVLDYLPADLEQALVIPF